MRACAIDEIRASRSGRPYRCNDGARPIGACLDGDDAAAFHDDVQVRHDSRRRCRQTAGRRARQVCHPGSFAIGRVSRAGGSAAVAHSGRKHAGAKRHVARRPGVEVARCRINPSAAYSIVWRSCHGNGRDKQVLGLDQWPNNNGSDRMTMSVTSRSESWRRNVTRLPSGRQDGLDRRTARTFRPVRVRAGRVAAHH